MNPRPESASSQIVSVFAEPEPDKSSFKHGSPAFNWHAVSFTEFSSSLFQYADQFSNSNYQMFTSFDR